MAGAAGQREADQGLGGGEQLLFEGEGGGPRPVRPRLALDAERRDGAEALAHPVTAIDLLDAQSPADHARISPRKRTEPEAGFSAGVRSADHAHASSAWGG